jgi:Ca2+-binding RTX toxin-like protein
MAFIRGNVIQDEVENFNPIRDENISNEFSDNEFFTESGFTFEDTLTLLNSDGDFYRLDFGGRSVVYRQDVNGDAIISGGQFTGFKESFLSGFTWIERYAAAGFSFSAREFYGAVLSTTRSDDIRVIQSILSGNDVFELSNQVDVVRSYAGNDRIFGFGGSDKLDGGLGNDVIDGGPGNDQIIGGKGKDLLSGKQGADKFLYIEISDSAIGRLNSDGITDFQGTSGDKIDLSAIDAYSKTIGNQAFTFIGSKGFTGTKGEVRFISGLLQVNTGVDKRPDMEIALTGVTSFNQFMLVL